MKTYVVRILNDKSHKIERVLCFNREHFTKRDYKMIVSEMFFISCTEGVNADTLVADLFCDDYHKNVLSEISKIALDSTCITDPRYRHSFYLDSFQNGSTVWAGLTIDNMFIRSMTISD